MTGVSSQFGADTVWVLAEPARFGDRRHVGVAGLHLYLGTNVASVEDLPAQFEGELRAVRPSVLISTSLFAVQVWDWSSRSWTGRRPRRSPSMTGSRTRSARMLTWRSRSGAR